MDLQQFFNLCRVSSCFISSFHRYELDDLSDIHKHLTNTARSAEDINFDEKTFVKVRDDGIDMAMLSRCFCFLMVTAILMS